MATPIDLIQHLSHKLFDPAKQQAYLIAFSGGKDSHVLLHSMSHLAKQHPLHVHIRAIHADHGLQPASSQWAIHCRNICQQLDIELEIVTLDLTISPGESIEAVARTARYDAFKQLLKQHERLLTAHHQEDQAETLLLQLLRGAGVNGLAAMPEQIAFDKTYLKRPFLDIPHEAIQQYADQHQLQFIDDPSNTELKFDRNYLRHKIVPRLKQRWPATTKNLCRSSELQAEARTLLESYVSVDFQQCLNPQQNSLKLDALQTHPKLKQKAIIRYWLQQTQQPMPSAIVLEHIFTNLIHAKADANPLIKWHNYHIRRYQRHLYIVPTQQTVDDNATYYWDAQQDFHVPNSNQIIKAEQFLTIKSLLQATQKMLTIRFRKAGEKIYIAKRNQHLSLKKIMQTLNIPPWERSQVPLLFLDDELIAIYGYKIYVDHL